MRTGYNPKIIFNPKGKIIAIATGSDACAEHECGIKPLRSLLVKSYSIDDVINSLKTFFDKKKNPFDCIKESRKIIPSIFDGNTITNTDSVHFYKDENSEEAFLCFGFEGKPDKHPNLNYTSLGKSKDIASAWSSHAMAIKVKTKKLVVALEQFHHDLLEGHCAFSGSLDFNQEGRQVHLSGIVIGNKRLYKKETTKSIGRAQERYDYNVILKALSKEDDIRSKMHELSGGEMAPGFLWPEWSSNEKTGIKYGLNPGYNVKADYFGPYTEEQLFDWAKSKYSYQLTNK